MKKTYTVKLALSFCLILTVFSIGILIFEQQRSKQQLTQAMEERMDDYVDMVGKFLLQHDRDDTPELDNLLALLPENLRLTLIDNQGTVFYDNLLGDSLRWENHGERPEIVGAVRDGRGSDIRRSSSNDREYLYYARQLGPLFVRVALPYNIQVKHFLSPDKGFLAYVLCLLAIGLLFIYTVSKRFGRTITRLRDFSKAVVSPDADKLIRSFPDDEVGEISRQIAHDYERLKRNETKLALERAKLLLHVQTSAEGVCFFTPDKQIAFYNGLFLQYMHVLSDHIVRESSAAFLSDPLWLDVKSFLDTPGDETFFEHQIYTQGRYFLVRVNIFDDRSFELVLNDITNQEKTRRLKQEMTGNIAHELRTPVTGMRAYLETILAGGMPEEKKAEFVQKAYDQTLVLSELISDMSLLAKIHEDPGQFAFRPVRPSDVMERVRRDLADELLRNDVIIHSTLPEDLVVRGNENLIYSIFRNLTDNVLKHAGERITIYLSCSIDDRFVYLSFADNGPGISDEKHLNRLFERFYRITEGRTRDTGGSGLGLSIVKNAVLIHGGHITAKNRTGGGLEFLFSLSVD